MPRAGPFWDAVEGRAPLPRAAAMLGREVLAVDENHGTIDFAFTAPEAWTNPAGNVLGAFVAASSTTPSARRYWRRSSRTSASRRRGSA